MLQSCRSAIEMLTEAFQEGLFGTTDAKVIYGQTDSLFINFRSSSVCARVFKQLLLQAAVIKMACWQSGSLSMKFVVLGRLQRPCSWDEQLQSMSATTSPSTWNSSLRKSHSLSCCCMSTGGLQLHPSSQGICARYILEGTLELVHRMSIYTCRYAGRAFESEGEVQEAKGALMVKGLKSMWRQAPPIVRNTLQGVLARIIMQACIPCKHWHNCH